MSSSLEVQVPESGEPETETGSGLTRVVGENLRRLRRRRALSLERLSRASGVSRAMLSQVELGRSAPTINVVWKIARALDVPLSVLLHEADTQRIVLRAAEAKRLISPDGSFSARALFPTGAPRAVEFYELLLVPHSVEQSGAHPPGTRKNLVVHEGELELLVEGESHRLAAGDAITFDADVAHEYRNEGSEPLRMYLVMTHEIDAAYPSDPVR